jgi:hypothetical protein
MTAATAIQLARLRTRFPDWEIIRVRCGTFIARHLVTRVHVQASQLRGLESLLREYSAVPSIDPTGIGCA